MSLSNSRKTNATKSLFFCSAIALLLTNQMGCFSVPDRPGSVLLDEEGEGESGEEEGADEELGAAEEGYSEGAGSGDHADSGLEDEVSSASDRQNSEGEDAEGDSTSAEESLGESGFDENGDGSTEGDEADDSVEETGNGTTEDEGTEEDGSGGTDIPDEMMLIPGGGFTRGCTWPLGIDCSSDERPERSIQLDSYAIDLFEVTVEQYEACWEAGECREPVTDPGGEFEKEYNWSFGRPLDPINGVDWFDAKTYCEWAGKRLPTEAEWEKAARGTAGNEYPWGLSIPDCGRAVIEDSEGPGCGSGTTGQVGMFESGRSPYGIYDMVGNVWEWTSDWYRSGYYESSASENPHGPESGEERSIRGGSYYTDYDSHFLLTFNRSSLPPTGAGPDLGFRCAMDVVEE